ncbi:hypothetical protein ACHAW6_015716 [Cyclotella cf. meneghiniana]
MASLQDKLLQLEEATATAHSLLLQKETILASASEALDAAKTKLRSLSPEAQADLQVNDTQLPELLEAKMIAQGDYDEAKKRYETNQRYVDVLREKLAKA